MRARPPAARPASESPSHRPEETAGDGGSRLSAAPKRPILVVSALCAPWPHLDQRQRLERACIARTAGSNACQPEIKHQGVRSSHTSGHAGRHATSQGHKGLKKASTWPSRHAQLMPAASNCAPTLPRPPATRHAFEPSPNPPEKTAGVRGHSPRACPTISRSWCSRASRANSDAPPASAPRLQSRVERLGDEPQSCDADGEMRCQG